MSAAQETGPCYHRTTAVLRPDLVMNHIYFTAVLAAELAPEAAEPHVYLVEATGSYGDDPNVTDSGHSPTFRAGEEAVPTGQCGIKRILTCAGQAAERSIGATIREPRRMSGFVRVEALSTRHPSVGNDPCAAGRQTVLEGCFGGRPSAEECDQMPTTGLGKAARRGGSSGAGEPASQSALRGIGRVFVG